MATTAKHVSEEIEFFYGGGSGRVGPSHASKLGIAGAAGDGCWMAARTWKVKVFAVCLTEGAEKNALIDVKIDCKIQHPASVAFKRTGAFPNNSRMPGIEDGRSRSSSTLPEEEKTVIDIPFEEGEMCA